MLLNERKQVGELARLREEVLALAVLYVFLQVERYLFGHAEILHVGRDVDTEFLAESEEMVDGMARCEDDGCMTTYRNVLRTEILGSHRFNLDKGTKYQFKIVLFCYFEIWRLGRLGTWLRYKNFYQYNTFASIKTSLAHCRNLHNNMLGTNSTLQRYKKIKNAPYFFI